MDDVNKALADIGRIRSQLTASQRFLGFTPPIIALTGCLAFALAALQSTDTNASATSVSLILKWVLLAILVASLIMIDAVLRARAAHQLLADRMLLTTFRQFAPACVVGAIFGLIILMSTPQVTWLLPGLWQMLVALGLFTALPNLPKSMGWVVVFYGLSGVGSLIFCANAPLNPWVMGLPFGVGQLLVALVLHNARVGD